eukprot:COSAG02_NODE_24083_length_698_cov_1.011686_2_plen_47_part_00
MLYCLSSAHTRGEQIGSDDETTNGCEASHQRTPEEVDCHRLCSALY